jgi:hypothetical protein
MAKILVHTPFTLQLPDGSVTPRYKAGVHEVEDRVAQHWFTKHHADVMEDEKMEDSYDADESTVDDSAGVESEDESEESESVDEDAELEDSSDENEADEAPVEQPRRGRRK